MLNAVPPKDAGNARRRFPARYPGACGDAPVQHATIPGPGTLNRRAPVERHQANLSSDEAARLGGGVLRVHHHPSPRTPPIDRKASMLCPEKKTHRRGSKPDHPKPCETRQAQGRPMLTVRPNVVRTPLSLTRGVPMMAGRRAPSILGALICNAMMDGVRMPCHGDQVQRSVIAVNRPEGMPFAPPLIIPRPHPTPIQGCNFRVGWRVVRDRLQAMPAGITVDHGLRRMELAGISAWAEKVILVPSERLTSRRTGGWRRRARGLAYGPSMSAGSVAGVSSGRVTPC